MIEKFFLRDPIKKLKIKLASDRKTAVGKLINKLFNLSYEIKTKGYLIVAGTNLSKKLIETLKIIENCTSCNGNMEIFNKSMNKIEYLLAELAKEEQKKKYIIKELSYELIGIDEGLNEQIFCGCCEVKLK